MGIGEVQVALSMDCIVLTWGPKVCKKYLLWAMWSPRVWGT